MKFTNGYWLLRDGVRAAFPAEAYDVEASAESLTVYAPAKRVVHRGDTLNSTLLTVTFSSPMPDVVRVRLEHWRGEQPRPPQFAIQTQPTDPTIEMTEQAALFTSGRLAVRVARGGAWRVEFLGDGMPITASGSRAMGSIDVDGVGHFMHEQLALGVGEFVYGLGERFTAFVKNGQVVDIWNEDGGTSSEQAYKNVPFYLSNRGYGVFVNDPGHVSFEVASEKVARVQFSMPGQALEYFVIYGPDPKSVLSKYTALTGRPALPPAWSFGLWLSTSFTTNYDEATVTHFIQGMADRDLPLHVFHFDCFWMREFNWCDFVWDARTFPDPAGMLARLKARGLKICVWINPYIAQRSPLFDEGMQNGYLLHKPNGDVWQIDMWQPGMALVDFTNPTACDWFASKLHALLDLGVDCFKTDFGERIPTDVAYWDGSDPKRMHNYYTHLYNQVVFNVLRERRGEGEAVVFARSATAGGQQFPVHWGGDCESTFESMAESLRGGLSLSLSGFGFWSHDIGGFEGTPPVAVYKRWLAFGLLSSHSRLHGSSSYRVPWQYDDEAVDVLRLFTKLKCRLMPYLYGAAVEAHTHGVPMMRAMLLEFSDDPTCDFLDRQYMLGGALLVAPVLSFDGTVRYYLPSGRWTNFFTGEVLVGPGWRTEQHSMLSLPLLVRPGTLLPLGAHSDRPDYDFADGVTLRLYELGDAQQAVTEVPTLSGGLAARFVAEREGDLVRISRTAGTAPWNIELVGVTQAQSDAGTQQQGEQGLRIALPGDVDQVVITLR
jgi:alpha-D-xyloside xylohydrolase